ncbi:hypothetical protein [Bosea minatitlanensis]|uniref:Uncharacterized protein n=1 Tax=Bosea minatitlanensis TaxID=128782 RepID=A0ABW0F2Q4_9HYPH|nr:hypothetical protein [Bosea minatitlanensis]MCT4492718.1 hypothetical protein [Bosea minatitlanensis]
MDLQDFEKLVRRSTGLVPMLMTQDVTPDFKGSTVGLFPKMAKEYFEKGFATPIGKDGAPVKIKAAGKAKPTKSAPNPAGEVAIPDDWRDLHHLQMLPIASAIAGEKVAKKDEAIAIIELELKRRAEG